MGKLLFDLITDSKGSRNVAVTFMLPSLRMAYAGKKKKEKIQWFLACTSSTAVESIWHREERYVS
jgi:hypothetical protein